MITDDVWKKITDALSPDPELRPALEFTISAWRHRLEQFEEYSHRKLIQRELRTVANTIQQLIVFIEHLPNGAYDYLVRDSDAAAIFKHLGPDADLRGHSTPSGYFHREICKVSLPFLKACVDVGLNRVGTAKKPLKSKIDSIRDHAICEIEELTYYFSGQLLKTGKYGSRFWLHDILNLIGCHTTETSVESAVKKWIKKRDTSDMSGMNYYAHRHSLIEHRCLVKARNAFKPFIINSTGNWE